MANELTPIIYVVENDDHLGQSLKSFLEEHDYQVILFKDAESFLNCSINLRPACLLTDINLEGINGLELLSISQQKHHLLPAILITGFGDIPMAVEALQKGAFNFLEKPLDLDVLLICIKQAIKKYKHEINESIEYINTKQRFDKLTKREVEVFENMLDGLTNKIMAHKMGISVSTIEAHRSKVMLKLQCRSLAEIMNMGKILKNKKFE